MARRKLQAKATMGEQQSFDSLLSLFETLDDPRVQRTRAYSLAEILFLVLAGVVSGVNFLTQIEKFGKARLEWLRTILPYENGVPSHDTIGRVLGMLDPDALERMFIGWARAASDQVEGVVAIDGKTLRRAISRKGKRSFVHMVSAFASANSLVLGQVKVEEKSNEITAIPRLLELLYLKGAVVTIDAAGCQTEIIDTIIKREADFVLAVKKNQPKLYDDVGVAFHDADISRGAGINSHFETEELNRGRGEFRRCEVIDARGLLRDADKWSEVKTLIRVTSERRGVSEEVQAFERIFISSIEGLDAERALAITRAHWAIENGLHWVLDVVFREDECRIHVENAAENLVVLRHMALNLLRTSTNVSGGVRSKREQAAWTDSVREGILFGSAG